MFRVHLEHLARVLLSVALFAAPASAFAETAEIKVAQQYGISYLPLMIMEEQKLIEKYAKANGVEVAVGWAKFAGGNVMNDALLSNSLQFASGGVGPFLTLWSRTRGGLYPAQATEAAPGRCKVGFWNITGRDLTLTINGQARTLPKDRAVTVELERNFVWQITGRDPHSERVPEEMSVFEVILRP